jgi:hypothetical protein
VTWLRALSGAPLVLVTAFAAESSIAHLATSTTRLQGLRFTISLLVLFNQFGQTVSPWLRTQRMVAATYCSTQIGDPRGDAIGSLT